jgi:hypothetical protein
MSSISLTRAVLIHVVLLPPFDVLASNMSHLFDVLTACPGKTTGIVTAQHLKRRVIQTGACRIEHLHEGGPIHPTGFVSGHSLSSVQHHKGRRISTASHCLHKHRTAISIPVTDQGNITQNVTSKYGKAASHCLYKHHTADSIPVTDRENITQNSKILHKTKICHKTL